MIYFTCDRIGTLFSELEYAPKRWLINDLLQSENEILNFRETIRRGLNLKRIEFSLQSELKHILPKLINLDGWKTNVPTLKAPDFFSRPIEKDLKTTLEDLLKSHPEYSLIQKLIHNSCLSLKTPEFYTVPLKGGYIIYGNPKATLGNLICFAHELGHALYELEHAGDELGSEVAAFLFEDEVARLVLQDHNDQLEWNSYKQKQDELNYFLCLNEFDEFKSGQSLMKKNHLFFRESLITCWGYQSIYAWASLRRSGYIAVENAFC